MVLKKKNPKQDSAENVYDKVKLADLPKFSDLRAKVDKIVENSSWFDKYGVDWMIVVIFTALVPIGCLLLRSSSWVSMAAGIFILGWSHSVFSSKSGHIAAHGGLTQNKSWYRILSKLFVEVIGSFSEEIAYDIHIKVHHPYTNIIGLGDSSTWKVPFLPRYIYMFVAPLLLPPMSLLVSVARLVEKRSILGIFNFIAFAGFGLAANTWVIMALSGMSWQGALIVIWLARGIFSIPYIHVNIFQHIGLPMYDQKSKPVRLYLMASGVLNLPRNPILDYAFGHSLISCHVEHHLFPNLSDNMCLKIKPVVSEFLKESGLPYNEKTYMNRLALFLDKYETLMVKVPPITHFVGIQ